jgi:hypothetical protein
MQQLDLGRAMLAKGWPMWAIHAAYIAVILFRLAGLALSLTGLLWWVRLLP